MNLHDHFHDNLYRTWPGFHNVWMGQLAGRITDYLPDLYFATSSGQYGIEIDVAALERMADANAAAEWTPTWTCPPPDATVEFEVASDRLEVLVRENDGGEMRVVGAVEFVSPANKDRPETRDAFVSKCHALLQDGIGVVIVDAVTSRRGNLHNDLMARLGYPGEQIAGHLYATAYRPTGTNGSGLLDIWRHPLAVGEPLPTIPLWLLGGIVAPADLSASYVEACRITHILRAREFFRPLPAPLPP